MGDGRRGGRGHTTAGGAARTASHLHLGAPSSLEGPARTALVKPLLIPSCSVRPLAAQKATMARVALFALVLAAACACATAELAPFKNEGAPPFLAGYANVS